MSGSIDPDGSIPYYFIGCGTGFTAGQSGSKGSCTFASPGVPVPFVAAIVDCGGTSVRGNLINVDPTPEKVSLGMKVRLATYSLGKDDNGVEAIGFGFEPA